MVSWVFVNMASGDDGLLPDGPKPSPEPMLTYHQLLDTHKHISMALNSKFIILILISGNAIENVYKLWILTHKKLEMYGCVLSTVATDVLVLKHQAITVHSTDWIFTVLDQFHTQILQ